MSTRHLSAVMVVAYFHGLDAAWKPSVHMIRKWAHHGHIGRQGRDQAGHTLYDVDDVLRHAKKQRLLPDD